IMRNLVILGGGYGGLKVLTGLLSTTLPDDLQIIVVDKNAYHSYKTEFHTIVAGTEAEVNVRTEFPVDDQVTYEFGTVKGIDLEYDRNTFQDSSKLIFYDYIVISVSCEDTYHDIEGSKEYTESVKSI